MEYRSRTVALLGALIVLMRFDHDSVNAFSPTQPSYLVPVSITKTAVRHLPQVRMSAGSDNLGQSFFTESPEDTQARIQELVQEHNVLLFMKGSKLFPQCGFSDTATKILEGLKVDFHAVDVLSDQAIRQGIKEFSQWPTIPQLYVRGDFIGGSDIMLEMYQNGELAILLNESGSG